MRPLLYFDKSWRHIITTWCQWHYQSSVTWSLRHDTTCSDSCDSKFTSYTITIITHDKNCYNSTCSNNETKNINIRLECPRRMGLISAEVQSVFHKTCLSPCLETLWHAHITGGHRFPLVASEICVTEQAVTQQLNIVILVVTNLELSKHGKFPLSQTKLWGFYWNRDTDIRKQELNYIFWHVLKSIIANLMII